MGNICFYKECLFSCEINFIFYKKLNIAELIKIIEAQVDLYLSVEFINDPDEWKIAEVLNQLFLSLSHRDQKPKFIEIQFPRKHISSQDVYNKIFDFFLEGYSLKLEFLGISMAMYSQKDFKIHIEATTPAIAQMISRAVSSICVFDFVQFSTYSCLLFYEKGENKKLEININRRSKEVLESFVKGFCGHEYAKLQFFLKITTKKTFALNVATFKQFLTRNKVQALEIKFDVNGEDAEGTLHFSKLLYSADISVAKKLILNFSSISMRPKSHRFIFECLKYVKSLKDVEILMDRCSLQQKNELEVACGISKLRGIRKLSLNISGNNLCMSPKTLAFLGAIETLSSLKLDLSQNKFGPCFSIEKSFQELIHSCENKKELFFNFSQCQIAGGKLLELSRTLSLLLNNGRNLEKLQINLFSVTSEREFACLDFSMIQREVDLRELYLNMSENSFAESSLSQIALLLAKLTRLNKLFLNLNFDINRGFSEESLKGFWLVLLSLAELKRLQALTLDIGPYLPDELRDVVLVFLLSKLKSLKAFSFGAIDYPNVNKTNLTKFFNKNIIENRSIRYERLLSMTLACKRNRLFRKLKVRREIKFLICNHFLLSSYCK